MRSSGRFLFSSRPAMNGQSLCLQTKSWIHVVVACTAAVASSCEIFLSFNDEAGSSGTSKDIFIEKGESSAMDDSTLLIPSMASLALATRA